MQRGKTEVSANKSPANLTIQRTINFFSGEAVDFEAIFDTNYNFYGINKLMMWLSS